METGTMDQSVRNGKIAKMTARGISAVKISKELKKMGEELSPSGVKKVLTKADVKEILDKEKLKLTEIFPEAVRNFDHWIRNARVFHDKTDKEIAYRATTKILESHGLVSGAPSEQVKITIQQSEVILSPVLEKMLAGFMDKLSEAKPIEPKAIDVVYEVLSSDKVSSREEISETSVS